MPSVGGGSLCLSGIGLPVAVGVEVKDSSDSFVASAIVSIANRVKGASSRAGVAPAEAQHLFTAHFLANGGRRLKRLRYSYILAAIRTLPNIFHVGGSAEGCPVSSIQASIA